MGSFSKKDLELKYEKLKSINYDKYVDTLLKIDFSSLDYKRPILVYSDIDKSAIYFTFCIYMALKENRLLDYNIITGQSLINQHFMNENKDYELYNRLYYGDITFISLSSFDYTSEYLESLIIELVEFRNNLNKTTIITYELGNEQFKATKLNNYFSSNNYTIIDLGKSGRNLATKKRVATTTSNKPIGSGKVVRVNQGGK